jgi:hypothetical protein
MGAVEDFHRNASETRRSRLIWLAAFLLLWVGACLYLASEQRKYAELRDAVAARPRPQTLNVDIAREFPAI